MDNRVQTGQSNSYDFLQIPGAAHIITDAFCWWVMFFNATPLKALKVTHIQRVFSPLAFLQIFFLKLCQTYQL